MFVTKPRASSGIAIDRGPGADFWFQPLGSRTAAGVNVSHSAAMGLSTVYSCVKVLAESFAIMPFELYRNDVSGKTRSMDRTHWLYRLFALRPNRFQNPFEWRLMIQGHLALRGNAYCQIAENGRGEIVELLPLHPDRMCVELVDGGNDYRYAYTAQNGDRHYYTRGQIWHLRGLSDDGIMGISPVSAARESIGEGLAMQSYSARFFGNDARPPGWIEYPTKFKDDETKGKWRDSWQRMQSGVNRGKVAVLENGMKYHELGLKNTDTQFIEGRQLKKSDIASIFRIPPHKIGDLSRASFANIEQQSIEFWSDAMQPYVEAWEASIRYSLLGQGLPGAGADDLLTPEFDMDRMMRGDTAARAAYYASRTQWGSMTLNEVREREGDEPLPWLNHTMRPVNMVRVDETGEHVLSQQGQQGGMGGAPDSTSAKDSRGMAAAAVATVAADRFRSMVTGNAQRMARRLAAGQATSADVLADALAISLDDAAGWLSETPQGMTESDYAAALIDLALKDHKR